MKNLEHNKKLVFLNLFNRDGYILDFSKTNFDYFTSSSIGVKLCEKYNLSMGKSLNQFLSESSDGNSIKILFDLFEYYERNYKTEYTKDIQRNNSDKPYDFKYENLYKQCKEIVESFKDSQTYLSQNTSKLKEVFSNDYLTLQIELMTTMINDSPTDAIGKAKELIESCCKTILDKENISYNKSDKMSVLVDKTLDLLELTPKNITDTTNVSKNIKALLGNLKAITSSLAEIRNPYGTGHGKSNSFNPLEKRHAQLAVSSSVTFVTFIWDTYEGRIEDEVSI